MTGRRLIRSTGEYSNASMNLFQATAAVLTPDLATPMDNTDCRCSVDPPAPGPEDRFANPFAAHLARMSQGVSQWIRHLFSSLAQGMHRRQVLQLAAGSAAIAAFSTQGYAHNRLPRQHPVRPMTWLHACGRS